MSVYVKERLEGKVIPYMMEEAIKEVLEKDWEATLTRDGYKMAGWHGPLSYTIKDRELEYNVDAWGKQEQWAKIKKQIQANYTSRVYQAAAMKAGFKNVSRKKEGTKIKILAR